MFVCVTKNVKHLDFPSLRWFSYKYLYYYFFCLVLEVTHSSNNSPASFFYAHHSLYPSSIGRTQQPFLLFWLFLYVWFPLSDINSVFGVGIFTLFIDVTWEWNTVFSSAYMYVCVPFILCKFPLCMTSKCVVHRVQNYHDQLLCYVYID